MEPQLKIKKWVGIKNCDTKQISGGYLYVEMLQDVTLTNINPAIIKSDPRQYKKGQIIGFSINAKTRKEAISIFNSDYIFS